MTKVTKIAATLAIAFAASSASAADFDGFYVGGGAAFNKVDVKWGYDTNTVLNSTGAVVSSYSDQDTYGDTEHSVDFAINAGYAMSFGNFNLAVELGYTSGYGEAEMYSDSNGNFWKYEVTGGKSLSILPGYKLGQDTLVYGRLGYVKAKGQESWDGGSEDSQNLSGMIWGIGMKHAFTENLMAVLEYQATKFDKETTYSSSWDSGTYTYTYNYPIEPASNGVMLGVQYMF